jgi:hypothetical protein
MIDQHVEGRDIRGKLVILKRSSPEQLPVFSANNPPAHVRERGQKSLPGAGLRAGGGG